MTVTDAPARTSARAAVRVPEPVGRGTLAPPTEDEKLRYADRRLWVLQAGSAISFGTLLASQIFFVMLSPWLLLLTPLVAFGVLYYLISAIVNAGTSGFDLRAHRRLVRDNTAHPSVDVFLPVCGEPPEVLANTWRYVLRMKRHYPGRVDVHVLDDSPTTGLARAALRHGFIYQRRLNRGWYKKAGNLRYAYRGSAGELILVLDADFAPRHDLLDELVPHLVADRTLGIVQSPQFFRVEAGQGWLQRGAGAVQELFYRLIQVSRQHHGAAICVGSCALYRRAALDAIGGSTLIEHSEDVHTGFDMRRKGWGLRYVPVPLAAGLCPADLRSFFTQQYRWCTGSMSLLGSTKFWNTRMSVRARLSYLSGFCYYLHTAVFAVAAPLIPVLMLTVFVEYVSLRNYLLIVPSTLYNLVVFPAWHRCRYSFETWTTKLVYGWAHFWAVWDIVRQRRMGWQATGGQVGRGRTARLRIGIAVWTAGSTGAWTVLAARQMITGDLWAFLPAFLAGAFFLTVALQALLVDPAADTRSRHLMLAATVAVTAFLGYAVAVDRAPATRAGERTAITPAVAALGQARIYDPAHLLAPDRKYLGVAIAGAPRSMAGVRSFARTMRAKPNMITIYEAFGDGYAAAEVRQTYAYGALPIIRWEPFDAPLADIAAGTHDAYVTSFAEDVRALNLPIALTFAHEMNGFWYPWGAQKNKAADFVTAWRRLHGLFEQAGATNVIWAWTPNVISGAPDVKLEPYYPGDAYVDWIGLDGYYTRTGAQTYRQLFDPTMRHVRTFTRRPFLIVETGAEPGPGRARAVRDLFDSVARDDRVLGFVYFNQKGTKRWEIDDDPAVAAVYRSRARSLRYGFTVS